MSNKILITLLSFCAGFDLAVCLRDFRVSALVGFICCVFALMLRWNE